MEFNTKRCGVSEFGKWKKRQKGVYLMGNEEVKKKTEE